DRPRKRWRAPVTVQRRARQLRGELTRAERELWRRLRDQQLEGYRFRRQHAVDRFIVDFFCPRARLVVEIDGDSHAEQKDYDAERTAWLEQHRQYRVVRFMNTEVHENIEAVLERIAAELKAGPHPGPPPFAGKTRTGEGT
ncbi:MAG TPA: DUF559 domain-containing protein, partial [Candidatus Acidoferrales bacterium]|nr:DUF559 domain-containing protein [Candidatus Acidoferrales bacterium]